MNVLLLNLLLALAWLSLTGEVSEENFVFGFILGYGLLWLWRGMLGSSSYFLKGYRLLSFILYFLKELVIANVRVAVEVLTPSLQVKPAIVAVPLSVKSNREISLLANLITLTPGTLSLDISDDKKTLYVHTMYMDDPEDFRRSIKDGFEKRVQEVFE
ncbi:MAG: Na+/H+ antiporter subunit E [Anaerolineae bacterium]|nr:Na+/H+ antiporter subunit E [Anaerolineae bacterium]